MKKRNFFLLILTICAVISGTLLSVYGEVGNNGFSMKDGRIIYKSEIPEVSRRESEEQTSSVTESKEIESLPESNPSDESEGETESENTSEGEETPSVVSEIISYAIGIPRLTAVTVTNAETGENLSDCFVIDEQGKKVKGELGEGIMAITVTATSSTGAVPKILSPLAVIEGTNELTVIRIPYIGDDGETGVIIYSFVVTAPEETASAEKKEKAESEVKVEVEDVTIRENKLTAENSNLLLIGVGLLTVGLFGLTYAIYDSVYAAKEKKNRRRSVCMEKNASEEMSIADALLSDKPSEKK